MNEGCPDSACELDIKSFAEDCRSLDESERARNTSTSREPRKALVRSQGACCAIFPCEARATGRTFPEVAGVRCDSARNQCLAEHVCRPSMI